jgi:hypothetical protein
MYILSEYFRRCLLNFSVGSYSSQNQFCNRDTGFLTKICSLNQQILCALLNFLFKVGFEMYHFLTIIERKVIFFRENANENVVIFL